MTTADVVAFTAAFNALRVVFPLRADKAEVERLQRVYFRALSRFPIERVEIAAETWQSTGTRFPKPAEWARAVRRRLAQSGSLDETSKNIRPTATFTGEPCAAWVASTRACMDASYCRCARGQARYAVARAPVTRGWAHGVELRESRRATRSRLQRALPDERRASIIRHAEHHARRDGRAGENQ